MARQDAGKPLSVEEPLHLVVTSCHSHKVETATS
uniref:Uncharacterized protein n=1 Tax=Oncorhynchus mykiss TaxID=8022 RepID=A0A8C7STA3_ONCMY